MPRGVLGQLPEAFAMEVVMRMLRMEAVQKEVLEDVERTLRTEFMSNLARTSRRDAHEMMAEIFNNFDRSTEGRFMSALEERSRDASEKIKALMFTFEISAGLDPGGVQTLVPASTRRSCRSRSRAPPRRCATCSSPTCRRRASKLLKDEMAALGPVRLKTSTSPRCTWSTSPRTSLPRTRSCLPTKKAATTS